MAQRSITSFFTRTPVKRGTDGSDSEDDTIGKKKVSTKKRRISSSDEETEKKTASTSPKESENKKRKSTETPRKSSPKLKPTSQKVNVKKEDNEADKVEKTPIKDSPVLLKEKENRKTYSRKSSPRVKKEKESTDSPKKAKQATIAFTKVENKTEESNAETSENKEESNKNEKLNGDATVKEEIKEESTIKKEGPTIKKEESTIKKEESTIKKEESTIKKEESTIKKEESTIKKEESTIKKEESTIKKEEESTPKKENVEKPKAEKKELTLKAAGQGQKGADYNPAKRNYHPINDAFWERGQKVPYLALAKTFELIEENSSRLKMIEILSSFFRSLIVLSPNDLLPCVYLCLNQLAPAYEGLELGVAETSLMKVIAQTTGRSMAQIKSDIQSTGDIGLVAERSRSNQRMMFAPAPLTVEGVFNKLKDIAKMTGHSAMNKKVDKIQSIFVACRHSEARFFIRSLAGKLRIGLAEQSLLQALAQACTNTPPNQKEYPPKILDAAKSLGETDFKAKVDETSLIVKTAFCQCPNYNKIIPALFEHGVEKLLDVCIMEPGTPLKPMLAQPTKGVSDVLQRFEGIEFTCEWKYDGERAQIHRSENGTISIYSRNQENNTSKYPDIISRIEEITRPDITSYILDCEVVAWDTENKQILPFQILSTRKRKDANESDIKVQVCVYMFDLLYLNKKPLVTEPFEDRRKMLRESFIEVEGQWKFATSIDTSDIDEVQNFLESSIKGNCEGLMVKTLKKEATYEIAKRSRNWLKLKKDYLAGVGDSLDLVVLGGFKGKGKRTGTYGGFLLGCYDAENEEYQSICKIGTGFSDEDLQKHTEFFKDHIVSEPKSYYRYDSSHEPDVWFEPIQVWEVKCADLSLSPVHKAAIGIVDPEKGISLRFPRFIRIRDDKSPEDATSALQVSDMYNSQDQIKNKQSNANKDIEEDFY